MYITGFLIITTQSSCIGMDWGANILVRYINYLCRGGSSKLIERGSYRVKGASGVFRMRERKSPSG